ncbi:MAG: preprotein translocase subunit Sec61beta [Candidatus Marsarchaeota archaeon]|jgi:preprotein translocase subunit Sec61beta|nr:preprotein translocase subunit Sec61beta [Candidatus Marsarchaeota archaeon]
MATLYSPQNQAGVMSFYDAPTKGPKINPKLVLVAVMVFAVVILILDHVSYLA